MKVVVIADFPRFGGTRTNLFRLLRFYKTRSWQTHLIANSRELDDAAVAQLTDLGCTFTGVHLPGGLTGRILRRTPFWAVVERLVVQKKIEAEAPDVIAVSTGTPALWLSSVLACPQPFIYFLFTSPIRRLPVFLRRSLQERLKRGTRSAIIAVSKYTASQINTFWFDSTDPKIEVIYNTVGPIVSLENTEPEPPTVLTVGHVTSYKNPFFWIDVASHVTQKLNPPPAFLWAGEGDLLESCQSEVRQRGLSHVRFLSSVSDVSALYERAHVYFQPSLVESHGISVLDAMRRGIPCVVSNRGGLPESIEHAKSGFCIDPNDPVEAAQAIIDLLNSPERRHELGTGARERYQELFSERGWEDSISKAHLEFAIPQ